MIDWILFFTGIIIPILMIIYSFYIGIFFDGLNLLSIFFIIMTIFLLIGISYSSSPYEYCHSLGYMRSEVSPVDTSFIRCYNTDLSRRTRLNSTDWIEVDRTDLMWKSIVGEI